MTNSHYWTRLTSAGRQAILDAMANDQTVEISEFGVGDGHLTPLQETLVQEKYRGSINSVKLLDTANLAEIIGVLPVGVGGFYVREAAFYMPDGRPFALVKHPETYKPSGDENAAAELKIKAVIDVENNHSVAEKIDPSLTYATREWVGDAINPHGLGTQISHQSANFFDRTFELRLDAGESKAFPDLPDTACDILIFGLTDGTATSTNFVGRFAKYGSTWSANTIYGNTNGPNHPSIKIIDNVPTFSNPHGSTSYPFAFKCWIATQSGGNAKPFEFFANTYSTYNKPTAEEVGAVPEVGRLVNSGSLNDLDQKSEVIIVGAGALDTPNPDAAFLVEISVVQLSAGKRVIQVAHAYHALEQSFVRYRSADGIWSSWGAFYTEHNKPKPADISEKLDRFERSYIDTNGGQDLKIRNKRALVGTTSNLEINYGTDWSSVYAYGNWNFGGDITITKNNPWLTLDSSSSGSDNIEQAAGISIGESGRTSGDASLHLTYTGNGVAWIGMGNLGGDGIPDNWAMQLNYQQTWVLFRSEIHLGDDKTKLSKGYSDSLRVVTPHGNVDIGPKNHDWCHFDTSMTKFYFGKPVHVKGEIYAGSSFNQRVYHEGYKPTASDVGAFQRHSGLTPEVNNSEFTTIAKVIGSALASRCSITLKGTTSNTVINFSADILVNHHKDIVVESLSGDYTQLELKILSNGSEDYLIQVKLIGGNSLSLHCHILSYTNDNVSIGNYSNTNYPIEHIHKSKKNSRVLSSINETNMFVAEHNVYHEGNKPTPADIGAVAKGESINLTDQDIIWSKNSDGAKIGFKNDADSDADSYLFFETSDNSNEYFKWRHRSGTSYSEWMSLRKSGLSTRNAIFDNGTNTTVNIQADDGGRAVLNVFSPVAGAQSTGTVYVGQSPSHGGGIEYNGDNSPATTGAGSDFFTLFRRENGTEYWTARNFVSSNDWEFRGNVEVNGDLKMIGSDCYIWTPNTETGFTGIWDTKNGLAAFKYTNGQGFDYKADIKIVKNNPWLTLDSSSSGSENIEQAAGISIGESGRTNAASLHLTYTGDGRGWLGMGDLGSDSIPDN
ncbi:phage tail protein [Pseudoalteromonas piscicida]|uniref:Phage tail fibre protein N-terminal domain-containing protein n=1 Tax=Pseudoalteromonas piscicida TaxID=43662 RepID=A0ABM6NA34_PSEO7|nr:phage tail protein [Pseudoalteromonas piscicida]ATD05626.1 hypothetical protein PPIS_a0297 [Pseudoalteromonas piscicida]WPU32414.1 phage tail protein [Pseudoalteromonas piscicida]